MAARIPLVDYLVLDPEPHLVANECVRCGARFFDRRNGCAACFATEFRNISIARKGQLRAFTIVWTAAPSVRVPFVAALVDCAGTSVRANVINVPPDPEHVKVGMNLGLATCEIGEDAAGTTAIGFAFEPID